MDIDDRHRLAMELYRSRRMSSSTLNRPTGAASSSGTLSKRNTLNRKSQLPPSVPPMVGKSPPRPSPASVVYHSDEESLKDYDENPDDSSLTEKASEISSTEQVNDFFLFSSLGLNEKLNTNVIFCGRLLKAKTKAYVRIHIRLLIITQT